MIIHYHIKASLILITFEYLFLLSIRMFVVNEKLHQMVLKKQKNGRYLTIFATTDVVTTRIDCMLITNGHQVNF